MSPDGRGFAETEPAKNLAVRLAVVSTLVLAVNLVLVPVMVEWIYGENKHTWFRIGQPVAYLHELFRAGLFALVGVPVFGSLRTLKAKLIAVLSFMILLVFMRQGGPSSALVNSFLYFFKNPVHFAIQVATWFLAGAAASYLGSILPRSPSLAHKLRDRDVWSQLKRQALASLVLFVVIWLGSTFLVNGLSPQVLYYRVVGIFATAQGSIYANGFWLFLMPIVLLIIARQMSTRLEYVSLTGYLVAYPALLVFFSNEFNPAVHLFLQYLPLLAGVCAVSFYLSRDSARELEIGV